MGGRSAIGIADLRKTIVKHQNLRHGAFLCTKTHPCALVNKLGIQLFLGSGFNVLIENQAYKYGVIATEDLLTDLLDWRYLYHATVLLPFGRILPSQWHR